MPARQKNQSSAASLRHADWRHEKYSSQSPLTLPLVVSVVRALLHSSVRYSRKSTAAYTGGSCLCSQSGALINHMVKVKIVSFVFSVLCFWAAVSGIAAVYFHVDKIGNENR